MPFNSPGKCANKSPGFVAASNLISDFVVSPFDDFLAVGDEKGQVSINQIYQNIRFEI